MNQEVKDKLFRYEELKLQEKEIKEELEQLSQVLLEVIPEETTIEARHGKFTKKTKRAWRYSEPTLRMEEELKARQKEEKQTGDAEEYVQSVFIEYRVNK